MKPTVAIDTNVIIRLLTRDDEAQFARALELFREHHCFIPKTVLMEVEWVLRFSYRFGRHDIGEALLGLMGMATVTVEDQDVAGQAMEWFMAGMDFAGALHLGSRPCR